MKHIDTIDREDFLEGEVKKLTDALQCICDLQLSDYGEVSLEDRFGKGYMDAKVIAMKALDNSK